MEKKKRYVAKRNIKKGLTSTERSRLCRDKKKAAERKRKSRAKKKASGPQENPAVKDWSQERRYWHASNQLIRFLLDKGKKGIQKEVARVRAVYGLLDPTRYLPGETYDPTDYRAVRDFPWIMKGILEDKIREVKMHPDCDKYIGIYQEYYDRAKSIDFWTAKRLPNEPTNPDSLKELNSLIPEVEASLEEGMINLYGEEEYRAFQARQKEMNNSG